MGTGSMGNTGSMGMEGNINMDTESKSKYTFCYAELSGAFLRTDCYYLNFRIGNDKSF